MVKFKQAIVLCGVLAAGLGRAQTMNVEDRMAVLEAQLNLVRKETDLDKALAERAGANGAGMPTVVSVNIVGGQRSVLLQLPNGIEDHFHEGDEVQQDLRVLSIGMKKVVVSIARGKKTALIALASATPMTNANPNDPNRPRQAIPNELLPAPPVVTVPVLKSILPLPSQVNAVQAAAGAKPVK